MRKKKRIKLPWVLTSERRAPAGRALYVRDTAWIEEWDTKPREGLNERHEFDGRHSHWSWGNPTHWRPATPAEAQQWEDYWDSWK